MARRNVTRATQRVRVDTVGQVAPSLSVVAPSGAGAGSSAARAARQLAEALGFAGQLAQRESERRTARGVEDALTGDVDEDLRERSASYRSGVVRVQAEAGWVHARREMEQKLDSLDLTSIPPDQLPAYLNQAIDDAAAEQYAGLDNPDEAEIIVPLLAKFRTEYIGKVIEQQKRVADQEQTANLRTIAGDAYAAAVESGTDFNYNAINERVVAVFGKTPRAQELSFEILADLAIRAGDPALLERMPDTWANGAPTAKIIPEFADRYRSALAQAQNVAAARKNQAEQELKRINEERARLAQLEAARLILVEGRDPQPILEQLLGMPEVDASAVFAIESAWRSARDDNEERDADPNAMAALWADLYTQNADIKDVMLHYSLGTLGRGPQATDTAQRMMAVVQQMQGVRDRDNSRLISAQQANIRDRYNPQINGMLGRIDATREAIQIEALAEYNQRVLGGGEDPTTVWNEVVEKYDAVLDRSKLNPVPVGSVSRQVARQGLRADPSVVKAFAQGRASVDDLRRQGVNAAALEAMYDAGQITADEANAAIEALLPTP